MIPYGLIQKIQEYQSNVEMSDCYIAITCKDERVFKFRFQNAPLAFVNSVKVIKKYALKPDLKSLFCLRRLEEGKLNEKSKL
jgi:hypothetical protein